MSRLHLIIFVLHWKMCLYLHWHFQVLNDSDLVHRPTYLLPFYLLNEVACTCHVSRIRRRVPLDNCSLWPWSSSLIIYQQVRLRLCIGTDLTFLRSFSLTTASILVKAFSTCVTIMKPFLKPDVRAICLHVWSQKNSGCNCDSTFPTFEISLIKSSLGSLCAGNALGDGQDGFFVVFNCILSTGVSLFCLSWFQLFIGCPSSFSLHVGNLFIVHVQFLKSRKRSRNSKDLWNTEYYMPKPRSKKLRNGVSWV